MERWNEPMLEPWEREAAISAILDRGLVLKLGIGPLLRTALNAQVLFFGVVDCIFLSILAAVVLMIPLLAAVFQQASPAPMLFLASPALYALLLGLTAWKESQSGLLEWKQTCRLSLQAVSALRMIVFGGGSVLVWVPVNRVAVERPGERAAPELDAGGVPVQPVSLRSAVPGVPGENGTGAASGPTSYLDGTGGTSAGLGRGVGLAGGLAWSSVPGAGRGGPGFVFAGIKTILPGAEERRSLCCQLNM